jgi:hypothetical protein
MFKFFIYPLLTSLVFVAISCHNPDILPHNKDKFKTYLIKKGDHYCGHSLGSVDEVIIDFDAIFDESAIYNIGPDYDQSNINKLLGFTDCGAGVHENSARFGWRWYNGKLEILAYCYKNGARVDEYITSVNFNEENNYKLYIQDDKYIFLVNNNEVSMPRSCSSNEKKYLLYPYFGGAFSAPHDIKIKIRLH